MNPTSEQLAAVNQALDALHRKYGVASDYALIKKLRELGLRTSFPVIRKWRRGSWNDADKILIAALTEAHAEQVAA